MNGRPANQLLPVILSFLSLCACGGGNSSGGGGTQPPPPSSEILYAANFSNSIFAFNIDKTTGGLTQTAAETPGGNTVGNIGMALTPSNSFLYAANNVNSGINGYATNSSGSLSLIAGSPFAVQPTSVGFGAFAIDSSGRFLYAANPSAYGIVGFTINNTTGALTSIPGGAFSSPGNGGPPLHLAIDPTGMFLYASASFDDVFLPPGYNIWAFTIDSQTGALTSMTGSPFLTQGNGQPQGIEVDPTGKFLYVALSNSNSIAAFTINGTTGALTSIPGSPFPTSSNQFTQTYDLTIAPSGKFLYALNLNGNTMAAFTIDSTSGVLTTVPGSPFAVVPNGESGFIVDPSGQFLYLALTSGPPSAFVIFNIDPNTGALGPNPVSPVAGTQEPAGLAVAQFH